MPAIADKKEELRFTAPEWSTAMREYEFEVTIVAVVRVRAGNEDRAREVVASSALGSPSPEEIRQANKALLDKGAAIIAIDVAEPDEEAVRLISVERGQ